MKSFKSAFGLKNRHFQTLYSSFFKKSPNLNFDIQRFELSDGDFVDCYWYKTHLSKKNTPIVVLFHGLAGSYRSPYIQTTMQKLSDAGFNSVLMHFRGCSTQPNRVARSYHSGETEDAKAFLAHLKQKFPHALLFGVGYSIGGNMLLKLLGEMKEGSPFAKAISISAPLQLDICADVIDKGFSKIYQYVLLKSLKKSLLYKYKTFNMKSLIKNGEKQIKQIKTFWEFDDIYTAPIHGFKTAKNYYKKCSSKQFLKDIKTPTLIIHAKDDPFMSIEILPTADELSQDVKLELYQNGGHVGFISGTIFSPKYWLEDRILEFFSSET
jgi:predicted alpha/beta-fold hydrolase